MELSRDSISAKRVAAYDSEMKSSTTWYLAACVAIAWAVTQSSEAVAQQAPGSTDDLVNAEQQAFQRAALAVGPSVVTIETIGGFDKLGEVRLNTGATTGTVIGKDGWIISSAFNLAGQPQAIFVTLDDGRRVPARRVATDNARKLVLLKAEATDLVPITGAAAEAIEVGRWAIAVGRTYNEAPNVSVGLVSALGRIGGLAIQTDTKVSPANYGGPLLDIRGDAMGVLVPMSPKTNAGGDELAGIEWYDSGIGFAVPIRDVIESARRLREGEDLFQGKMGLSFTGTGLLDESAEVETVHPLGPADEAGVKRGDVFVSINGEPVSGLRELKLNLAGLYAGEEVSFGVKRGDESLEVRMTLVAEPKPYEFAALGVLADRADDGRAQIREVFDGGPAAGRLEAGDVIEAIGGEDTESALAVQLAMQRQRVGDALKLRVKRGDQQIEVDITPTSIGSDLPAELKVPDLTSEDEPDDKLVGRWTGEVLEGQVSFWAYTPPAAAAGKAAGLIVWLAEGGEAILPAVRQECHARNIALLVPSPASDDWTAGDTDAVDAAISEVVERIPIDSRRVAVVASGTNAVLGLAVAEAEGSVVRGLVLDRPRLSKPPSAVSPERRLLYGLVDREDGRTAVVAKFLEAAKHPVTILPVPFEDGEALVRWVDWMGRL